MSTVLSIGMIVALLAGAYAAWAWRAKRQRWPLLIWAGLATLFTLGALAADQGADDAVGVLILLGWLVVLGRVVLYAWLGEPVSDLGCVWRIVAGLGSVIALPITFFVLLGAQFCEEDCDGIHIAGGFGAVIFLAALLTLAGMLIEGVVRLLRWMVS